MNNDRIKFSTEELARLKQNFKRNFINSVSGNKSVNLVGTIDKNNKTNLAIFNTGDPYRLHASSMIIII